MGNAKMESGKGNSGVAASTIYAVMDKQILDGPQWRDAAIIIDKKINESADVQDYIGLSKIYTAMGNTQEAINQLDTAIRKYPDFDKRGNLILRAGFLGWEHLKDHEVAEKYYTQLINEYPNHPQVQEIKTILSSGYLQMSDEEILEQLRNKDK
jgi:tetratricopeptide (TPR) repeat protein